jgi:hypothetical protein
MIECSGVVDSALRRVPGLLGKSLEPEDTRERDTSHDPLAKLKPGQRRPLIWRDIAAQHALDMVARVRLVSAVMQRAANYPIAHGQLGRVVAISRQAVDSLSERQRGPEFATAHPASPKPQKRA